MSRRKVVGIAVLAIFCLAGQARLLCGAITSNGDVAPSPPVAGGAVVGPFRVGNTTLGTMSIAGGTALTSSSNAFVGDAATGLGVVTMDGFGSNWTLTTAGADLAVGVDGTGSVSVTNFARMTVPDDTVLGDDPTGVGEIIIADLGTVWSTGNLIAGGAGLGVVNVVAGGQLVSGVSTLGDVNGSEGRVTIADALSLWRVTGGITVGAEGRGTVSILDGGTLRTTAASTIGNGVGTVGTVEVNGAGALWNSDNSGAILGGTGTGKLHIFNGGRVFMEQALSMASNTGSRGEVWVDGLNSTLSVATQISSGVGEANITVSNGGVITASTLPWGPTGRMTLVGGRVEETAQGSFDNQGLIQGHGTIDTNAFNNQQNGSIRGRIQVGADERLLLTGALTNSGLADINGGELEVLGTTTNNFDIDARNGATLRFGGSTFALDNIDGSQLAISTGRVDVFGTVRNNNGGQILVGNGASAVFHDTITNNGDVIVMPGSTLLALEQLNLLGSFSNLSVQLGDVDALEEEFPVQSAGTMIIEGNLDVTLAAGYQPQAGDVFPLLFSGDSLAGVFSDENLPGLSAGLAWEAIRTTNALSLAVVASSVAGDFDGDGDVDGRDFLIWQRGGSPSPLSASDLADWQAGYGTGSLVSTSVAVPEPSTLAIAIIGLAVAMCEMHTGRGRVCL